MERKNLLVVARQDGMARTEMLEGREHLVFPAVLVREQVLHNNLGATFLPFEEIEFSAPDWNDVAVVVRHPEKEGQAISARSPDVLNSVRVGRLYNARAEGGSLRADVWLDLARVDDVEDADAVLNTVNEGEPAELSTGFAAQIEVVDGEHDGEAYEMVLRDIRPDHLALLPDEIGACSVADGCGLARNVRETPRRPTYDGTESTDWSAPTLEDYTAALGYDADTVEDLTSDQKSTIAAHTLLGESDADTFEDLSFFPVVNPSTSDLNENALRAVISGRGSQADIPADTLDQAQSTARSLLEEEFDMDTENVAETVAQKVWARLKALVTAQDEMSLDDIREAVHEAAQSRWGGTNIWVWVAELFDDFAIISVEPQGEPQTFYRVDYTVDETERSAALADEAIEVERVTEFVPAENGRIEARHEYLATPQEETDMDREELLNALCDCDRVAFRRETLEAMTDEELAHVATQSEAVEAEAEPAPEGTSPEGGEGESEDEPVATNEAPAWFADALSAALEPVTARLSKLEEDTEPARNQVAEERREMIQKITNATDFEASDLEEKSMGELRILSKAIAKPKNFTGLGGPKPADPSGNGLSFSVHSTLGAGPGEPMNTDRKES